MTERIDDQPRNPPVGVAGAFRGRRDHIPDEGDDSVEHRVR